LELFLSCFEEASSRGGREVIGTQWRRLSSPSIDPIRSAKRAGIRGSAAFAYIAPSADAAIAVAKVSSACATVAAETISRFDERRTRKPWVESHRATACTSARVRPNFALNC